MPDPPAISQQDQARQDTLDALAKACIVAVIRAADLESARGAAHALIAGGLTAIEITLTVPGATALIAELAAAYRAHPNILIGAGTVLTADQAGAALSGGA